MANTINNIKDGPGVFVKGIAETLRDNMQLCGFVDKVDSSELDGKNGFKSGDVVYTSIPPRYTTQSDNLDISSLGADSVEEKKALTVDKSETIRMDFDSLELATDVDIKQALTRYGIPAAESLAQNVETRCFDIVKNATYNFSGAANSYSIADVLATRTKLNQDLAPLKDRMLFLDSASGALATDARSGKFQSSEQIKKQYEEGYIGRADGYDWVESELVSTHTNGTDTDPAAVNNASHAEGASTLIIDALGAGSDTITKGTVFTIAGVNKVHPITKVDLGVLQQFVVTADFTASSGGGTLSISPSTYAASGGLQNVTALPADNAVVTFATGTASTGFRQGFGLHKSAFKMVTVPLYQPKGVDMVATATVDGITVNLVRDFDVQTRKVITRADVLFGFDAVRPEWSSRIAATS